jgi:hypothetical protein
VDALVLVCANHDVAAGHMRQSRIRTSI